MFSVTPKLLVLASVEGDSVTRERCGEKNACDSVDSVAERRTGMRVIAVFLARVLLMY